MNPPNPLINTQKEIQASSKLDSQRDAKKPCIVIIYTTSKLPTRAR